MTGASFRGVWVFVATVGMLVANGFPGALGFRGETVGSISDKIPSLMTPAGYAFSIWSVIYTGLLGFAIFQWLPAQREDQTIKKIAGWYVLSCVFNSVWIFVWLSKAFWLSWVVIVALLASLVRIYLILDADRSQRRGAAYAWVAWPFSLYTAWVTVATVINTVIALKASGWQGGGISPEVWSMLLIAIAAGLFAWIAIPRRDVTYLGVLVWALTAIGVANAQRAPSVAYVAWAVAAAMFLLALRFVFQAKNASAL